MTDKVSHFFGVGRRPDDWNVRQFRSALTVQMLAACQKHVHCGRIRTNTYFCMMCVSIWPHTELLATNCAACCQVLETAWAFVVVPH